MDKKKVAARLLSLAKRLVADMTWDECIAEAKKTGKRSPEKFCGWLKAHGPNASVKQAEWKPVRKDVDVGRRNQEMHQSLTSFAPALGKEMKKRMAKSLNQEGYEVRPNDLTRVWSQYLVYIDEARNNNKYHYYAVYQFTDNDGMTMYVAGNCSGRIGIVERAYDLTQKYLRSYPYRESSAIAAAEKHLKSKLGKGYERIKMTRG